MNWEKRLAPIVLRFSDPKFSKRCPQNFSIPEPVVRYISKEISSPKLYRKLRKTCKYFPQNNQVFFLHCLSYEKREGGYSTCNKLRKNHCGGKYIINGTVTNQLNVNDIPQIIWIEHVLSIDCRCSNGLLSTLIPRLKCTADSIHLDNSTITLKEFQSVCRFAKECHLKAFTIIDENNGKVSQPDILKQMPKLLKYSSTCVPDFLAVHLQEILESFKFKKLKEFSLWDLTEIFDIEEGFLYLKKNKTIKVRLTFSFKEIGDEYKKKIGKVIDEIVEEKSKKYYPPFFVLPCDIQNYQKHRDKLEYLHEIYKVKERRQVNDLFIQLSDSFFPNL